VNEATNNTALYDTTSNHSEYWAVLSNSCALVSVTKEVFSSSYDRWFYRLAANHHINIIGLYLCMGMLYLNWLIDCLIEYRLIITMGWHHAGVRFVPVHLRHRHHQHRSMSGDRRSDQ